MASEVKVKMIGLVPFGEIVDFIRFGMGGCYWFRIFPNRKSIQKSEKPYRPH